MTEYEVAFEDNDTILLVASTTSDGAGPRLLVRCSVGGLCERVGDPEGLISIARPAES